VTIRETLTELGEDIIPQLEAVAGQHIEPTYLTQFMDTVLGVDEPFSPDYVRAIVLFTMQVPGVKPACYYAVSKFFTDNGFKVRMQRTKGKGKANQPVENTKAVMITPAAAAEEQAQRDAAIAQLDQAGQDAAAAIAAAAAAAASGAPADPNAPPVEGVEVEDQTPKKPTPTFCVEDVFSYAGSVADEGFLTLAEGSKQIKIKHSVTVNPGRIQRLLTTLGTQGKKAGTVVYETHEFPPAVSESAGTGAPSGHRLRRLVKWYTDQNLDVPDGVAAE